MYHAIYHGIYGRIAMTTTIHNNSTLTIRDSFTITIRDIISITVVFCNIGVTRATMFDVSYASYWHGLKSWVSSRTITSYCATCLIWHACMVVAGGGVGDRSGSPASPPVNQLIAAQLCL